MNSLYNKSLSTDTTTTVSPFALNMGFILELVDRTCVKAVTLSPAIIMLDARHGV